MLFTLGYLAGVVSTFGLLVLLGRAGKKGGTINSKVPTEESVVAVLTRGPR